MQGGQLASEDSMLGVRKDGEDLEAAHRQRADTAGSPLNSFDFSIIEKAYVSVYGGGSLSGHS